MTKRSQQELIGLMFIVIIVVIAMLFYLVYSINNPSQPIKKTYMSKELATNMVIALTKVSVRECPRNSIGMLLTDCAKDISSVLTCGGKSSCEAAEIAIREILYSDNENLDLGKNMSIKVERTSIEVTEECYPRAFVDQGFQVLTMYPTRDTIEITLDVCDG